MCRMWFKCTKESKESSTDRKDYGISFWNAKEYYLGIIYIGYLEKEKTITGDYYAALLDKLVEEIKENRPYLHKKK